MKEKIKFQIQLSSKFWDRAPLATVLLNGCCYYSSEIFETTPVEFLANLDFGKTHLLQIHRTGKTPDQTRFDQGLDQLLLIDKLTIDHTPVDWMLLTRAIFKPDYPEPWATEQRSQGLALEQDIIGEVVLGHNGLWCLSFSSPFYKFIMDNV